MIDENQLKALVFLLDDQDAEVQQHVEDKLRSFGIDVIPFLEAEWAARSDASLQHRILKTIQQIQFDTFIQRINDWKISAQDDLLQGMWAVATYLYPNLQLSSLQETVNQFYYQAWVDFLPDVHPVDQVRTLNSVFFNKLKFRPNTKEFHAVSNSMINQVIESRKGNPISLCVLYLLIAKKLGMPVYGVNLPNLFILTYQSEGVQFYINAFNKGLVFSKTDIDSYISQLNIEPQPAFYNPCSNMDIIRRVLRNLYVAYNKEGESERCLQISEALKILGDFMD